MIKYLVALLALVPLALRFPYLMQAWSGSRLDRWDWLFYLLFVPAAVWALRKEKWGKCDFSALLVLMPMLLLALGEKFYHINAIAVAASSGVIFAAVWLLGAWQAAYRLLPAVVILLLGTPSSSYQLSLLLMCPVYAAWVIKFALALLCLGWIWYNKRRALVVKCGTLCFAVAALASGMLLLHSRELYFEGESFTPEFTPHIGDFWGRSITPDENTKRFFATSSVRQFRYAKSNADISVLAVQCGKNIHEIHPASHCLRTSMWTVNSESVLHLPGNFAVTEIDAVKGRTRMLVWVWFSSEKISTPSFLGFRRHFQSGSKYYTYQISIPVYSNIETSRKELEKFLFLLKKEMKQ